MSRLNIFFFTFVIIISVPTNGNAQYTLKYISSNDILTNLPVSNLYLFNEDRQECIDSFFFNLSLTRSVSFSHYNNRKFAIVEKYSSEYFGDYNNYSLKTFNIIDNELDLTQNLFFSTDVDSIKFLDRCCIEIESDKLVISYINYKGNCSERSIYLESYDFYLEFQNLITEISSQILPSTESDDKKRLTKEEIIKIIDQ